MIHWKLLPPWFLRAWPVLWLAPVAGLHFIAYQLFPADTVLVNKVVSASLQFIGGILVLWSVNDNLKLFRSQTLKSAFFGWFKDFPSARKPVNLCAITSAQGSGSSIGLVAVSCTPNTLEERVAEIERKLNEVRTQIAREVQAINVKIEEAKFESGRQIAETSIRITDLTKLLERTAVGSFKLLTLGVFFVFWGSVTSVFA